MIRSFKLLITIILVVMLYSCNQPTTKENIVVPKEIPKIVVT